MDVLPLQQAERIATLTERVASLQQSNNELRQEFREFIKKSNQQQAEMSRAIELLTLELSARKEFGRGVKFGITVFWILLGGTITTFINKWFFS